jgi:DnaJ-class molecular chaperone
MRLSSEAASRAKSEAAARKAFVESVIADVCEAEGMPAKATSKRTNGPVVLCPSCGGARGYTYERVVNGVRSMAWADCSQCRGKGRARGGYTYTTGRIAADNFKRYPRRI